MNNTLTTPQTSTQPPITSKSQIQQSLGERVAPYTYIAPFFLIFTIFGLFPLLFTFYIALFN